MRITSAGNLGIGTTSPSQKLHVTGNARVTGALYDSNNSPGTSNQILSSTVSGTDWVDIGNLGTFLDIIDVSEPGNTTTEWSLIKTLPVSNATQRDTLFIKIVGGGWNNNMRYEAEITLSNRDGFNYFWDVKGGSEYSTSGNGSNRLRVVAYSQTDGTVDVYLYKTSYMTGWIYATFQNTGAPEIITSLGSPTTTQPSGTEVFTTYGNTYPANIAAVNNRVGIGTNYPNEKLQLAGNLNAYAPSGIDAGLFASTAAGSTTIALRSSGVTHFNGGNVGIGTTSPNQKLTIKGTDQYVAAEQTNYVWGAANTIGVRMGTDATAGLLDFRRWTGTSTTHGTALITQVNSDGGYGLDFRVDNKSTNTSATSSRMFLSTSGEVGIGTTSPTAKLGIHQAANNGNTGAFTNPHLKLSASATADGSGFCGITAATSTANNYGYSFGAQRTSGGVGDFKINYHNNSAAGTNRFLIDQDGNVGIGTTSPGQKLHVYNGSAYITPIAYAANQNDWVIKTGAYNNTGFDQGLKIKSSSGGASYMAFETTSAVETMVLRSGKVGIGTDSPGHLLEVRGTADALSVGDDSNTNTYARFANDRTYFGYLSSGNAFMQGGNSKGISFHTGSSTLGAGERMRITSSGLVGISDTSPSHRLSVSGNVKFRYDTSAGGESVLFQNNTSGGAIQLGFQQNDSDGLHHRAYIVANKDSAGSIGGQLSFRTRTVGGGTTEAMNIRANGNVGIGTTNPTETLHVGGTILAGSTIYSGSTSVGFFNTSSYFAVQATNGMLVRDGSTYKPVGASAFTVVSDYRLKSNIVPLENAITRFNQLEVHRFNWNDRLDEPKVDGFIAHEVSSIVPEAVIGEKDAVHEDGTPKHQGIDQAKLVPLLTAALQEAIIKIENLESRIQTLENQ